jgi:hypothetical protein
MAAKEMNGGQLELLITVVTSFLVEGTGSLLHAVDLALHGVDVLHVVLNFVVVLINTLHLSLEFVEQKLLQNFEPQNILLRRYYPLELGLFFPFSFLRIRQYLEYQKRR